MRIGWVDYARAICIVCVVFGHAVGGLEAAGILSHNAPHAYPITVMYAFRMPTLFFIAGLFLARSTRRPARHFLTDRVAVLLFPYVVWTLIHAASREVVWDYTNRVIALPTILANLPFRPFGEMWFLYALFIVSLVVWGLDRLGAGPRVVLTVSAALFGLQFALPESLRPTLGNAFRFCVYAAIGFIVVRSRRRTSSLQLPVRGAGVAALGAAAVVLVLAAYVHRESPLAPLVALPGIVMVAGVSRVIDAAGVAPWLRGLGTRSLQIYLAHPLATGGARILLKYGIGVQSPVVYVVVCTALGLLFPLLMDWAARRAGAEWVFSLRPLLRRKQGTHHAAASRPGKPAVACD